MSQKQTNKKPSGKRNFENKKIEGPRRKNKGNHEGELKT